MHKVAIVRGSFEQAVHNMFITRGWETVSKISEADLVCFTGGDDIHPSMYGQHLAGSGPTKIKRDLAETRIFRSSLDKPKVGICRGAQLCNVLSGGRLWQDVNKHGSMPHKIEDRVWNKKFEVSSLHHQMMIPGPKAEVLAVASEATSFRSEEVRLSNQKAGDDPEVVYYPQTKSLCMQSHPELNRHKEETDYLFCLLFRLFRLGRPPSETTALVTTEKGPG